MHCIGTSILPAVPPKLICLSQPIRLPMFQQTSCLNAALRRLLLGEIPFRSPLTGDVNDLCMQSHTNRLLSEKRLRFILSRSLRLCYIY